MSLHSRFLAAALVMAALLTGCPGPVDPDPDSTPDAGQNQPPGNDGGTNTNPDGGGTTTPTDGGTDADVVPVPGPRSPSNFTIDSDCDGLTDAEEWGNLYPGNLKTDPGRRDTDGDGLRDGLEVGRTSSVNTNADCQFVGDADATSRTNPAIADTDGDGLSDGAEDTNRNGKLDPGETDPANPDTDGDGLREGVEDKNLNGVVDPGETDPRKRDTDEDGLSDSIELNVTFTDPRNPDTDGDSCKDGAEDRNGNGRVDVGETNPKNGADCGAGGGAVDTDGDGLSDALEDANRNGVKDPGETDARNRDTDGDGLGDGLEDRNRNGLVDSGETDPRTLDTDCDGLVDGPSQGSFKGEDLNGNGVKDPGETDPANRDSDGDGLLDGVERGVTTSAAPVTTCGYSGDADPATTTDPLKADSDLDGIADGAEDSNQNGRKDTGELDPLNGADGASNTPAGQACTTQNLRQVAFKQDSGGDVRLALRPSFQEVTQMMVGGTSRGFIGYDSTNQVAFIAYKRGQVGTSTTAVGDELGIRPQFNPALTMDTTQTFTTWDGFPALKALYTQSATTNLRDYANSVANQLVGTGAGVLTGGGSVAGPYKLQVQYVHRSNASVMVVVAITPSTRFVEPGLFVMGDTAGGTALAQFGDADAVQCETFTTGNSKVDFLFVVDDSNSMDTSQAALGNAATAIANRLSNSLLDWRIGMVTSTYTQRTNWYCADGYACPTGSGCTTCNNHNVFRGFTNDISQFQKWLTVDYACRPPPLPTSEACWVGVYGSADEQMLGSGMAAVNYMTTSTTPVSKQWRQGAQLVVVVLSDARDQTPEAQSATGLQNIISFYRGTNPTGQLITMHGIICDPTSTTRCNSNEDNTNPRHLEVIQATGGVYGLINNSQSIQNTINTIMDSVISGSGYRTLKPPIGASVRVALESVMDPNKCSKNDVPRSRVDGFDVDGLSQSLAFYGACRPGTVGTTKAAVSYRAWSDLTPNRDGNPPPCSTDTFYDPADSDFCGGKLICNRQLNRCECPSDCGGGGLPGQVCNTDRNVCAFTCAADCGGTCGSFQSCNMNTCSCQCVESASCATGYKFDPAACGCVCDTASLSCGDAYQADPNTCACVCKADCGGTCGSGTVCNMSTCRCEPKLN